MKAKATRFSDAELRAIESALKSDIRTCEKYAAADPENWESHVAAARSAQKTVQRALWPNLTDADHARIEGK